MRQPVLIRKGELDRMMYRESSEMIIMLAAAGSILAGLSVVLAAAALYYKRKKKKIPVKGCGLQALFFLIAALPFLVVPLLAYASDSGDISYLESKIRTESEAEPGSKTEKESEMETGSQSESESGTEPESESESESGTEPESESESESETESESESESESETETEGPDAQTFAKILEKTEWIFTNAEGKPVNSSRGILQTGGLAENPSQVCLQIRVPEEAVKELIKEEGIALFQVFGGTEKWRKQAETDFRKTQFWAAKDKMASWKMTFEEDGSYLVQIGVKKDDRSVPLICAEKEFVIDTVRPVAVLEPDPKNQEYCRGNCSVRVRVNDANPDELVLPQIRTDGPSAELMEWQRTEEGIRTQIAVTGEGRFSVTFTARDQAGNLSLPCIPVKMVIDKTPPRLQIQAPEGREAGNTIYTASPQEIIVSAYDSWFDAAESGASVISGDGGNWQTAGWTEEADRWRMHIYLNGDGRYHISAWGSDLAGNRLDQALEKEIVVDTAAPALRVTGAESGASYAKEVDLQIEAEDQSLFAGNMHVTLLNQLDGKKIEKDIPCKEELQKCSLQASGDGIYILQAHAADGAGNTKDAELRFRINVSGSRIEPDSASAQILLSGFMKTAVPMVFTERNIDTLVERRLVLTSSRSVRILEEGTDYSVLDRVDEKGVHSFRYEIPAACFAREGTYTLHMYSKDAAGNEYAGSREDALWRFTADYSPPQIFVTGLEDGGVYRMGALPFRVTVTDAVGVDLLRVTVGDEIILERGAGEIQAAGGSFSLELGQSEGEQEIRVEAVDAVGREAQPQVFHVLVLKGEGPLPELTESEAPGEAAENLQKQDETERYHAAQIKDAGIGFQKSLESPEESRFLSAALTGIGIAAILLIVVFIRHKKKKDSEM